MQFIERLTKRIRESGTKFNSEVQEAPGCILWTDKTRQWEGVTQILLNEIPELVILGDYDPENRTGPAIWIRCVISKKINDVIPSSDSIPIIYLPGVSRQELRSVENCPKHLKPLVELQFRGAMWSQANTNDWTILAFLGSRHGGLGLEVARDNETKDAMLGALDPLLALEVESLKGKKLDKDFFNTLLASDYTRHILQWIDQEDDFKSNLSENQWQAFIGVCLSYLKFNPEKDGILKGASKLVSQDPAWTPVWDRFCEAPNRYPNIPSRIRGTSPNKGMDWWNPRNKNFIKWPQWNEDQENLLQEELETLEKLPPQEARTKIIDLEKDHGARRSLLWAELGEAQLAKVMEPLSVLADVTQIPIAAGSIDDLSTGYQDRGWLADKAVIDALTCIDAQKEIHLLTSTIQKIYTPWAQESARYLQKIIYNKGYPGGNITQIKTPVYTEKECVLFVDGLRFDQAKKLVTLLEEEKFEITENVSWAALPSVTATGKPAVTPVRKKIFGSDTTTDFEPAVAETGKSLRGGRGLKRMIEDAGWCILDDSLDDEAANAWCEFGDIDHEGHENGWKLALQLDVFLNKIQDHVKELFQSGWKKVRIVTDHGWLLLPGNLPKIDLPSAQTDTKWGRCARIKIGASTKERSYPWFWNPDHYFALADGISCFRNGIEYAHGGVSLQECLTLEIVVSPGVLRKTLLAPEITNVIWKGLRCTVSVEGTFGSLAVDIRTHPGDPATSIVTTTKTLNNKGIASVIVENEDLEGNPSTIVIVNERNELVTQFDTIIGG